MISKEIFDIISPNCWHRESSKCDTCFDSRNVTDKCNYDGCPKLKESVKKHPPLTPEEFTREMAKLHKDYIVDMDDEELCHINMDNLIRDMLIDLGYEGGASIFENTHKWYA